MVYDENFKTISEFKTLMRYHGEVSFAWNHIRYGIFWDGSRYCIARLDGTGEKWCNNVDDLLEYMVGEDRLRDVITKVQVIDRSL